MSRSSWERHATRTTDLNRLQRKDLRRFCSLNINELFHDVKAFSRVFYQPMNSSVISSQ